MVGAVSTATPSPDYSNNHFTQSAIHKRIASRSSGGHGRSRAVGYIAINAGDEPARSAEMQSSIFRLPVVIIALGISQGASAGHPPWEHFGVPPWEWPPDSPNPPPNSVWLDCDPSQSIGNPALEPVKGRGKRQRAYLGIEGGFCWQIELKCDDELAELDLSGFFVQMDVWGGGGFAAPFIHHQQDDFFCDGGMSHKSPSEFSHTCSFEIGEAELEVKAVDDEMCSDLGDVIPPPPPSG